ncbi:MAG: T9SS type A sorting domain-containing protein, partial [Dysgonamonadaceae bacterium]|nr:T9SS type A sorting domain-containing protein [Dysgonamonadaceae bacterium]
LAVAQNDGVTFSPETGGVGKNETWATFGVLSKGDGVLKATLTHPCGTREATQTIHVDYPTGMEKVTANEVAVYPNPTSGVIKVSGTKLNQIIRIMDVAGSLKGSYPAQDAETTIDLSGYAKGTYLVHYGGKAFKVVRK